MKKVFLIRPLALSIGILLVVPSLYFVVSALLNYRFGLPTLWKVIEPIFEKAGNQSFGFNISLLVILGPLVAIMINLAQVIQLHFARAEDEVYVYLSISKYKYSWIVVATGCACLGIMFFYMLAENCWC